MAIADIRNTTLRRILLVVFFAPATLLSAVINGFVEGYKTIRGCPRVFTHVWRGDYFDW